MSALIGTGGAGLTFRWHATPRRMPALTDAHLQKLKLFGPTPPRVLFVGNSMVLRHNLIERVASHAEQAGQSIQVAAAAATGARLIETWSIDTFREVLRFGWDILVLQDYSGVCLRAPDRWGSAYAMQAIAEHAQTESVLLYPTWAFPAQHGVYRGRVGFFARTPRNPEDFAQAIIAYYSGIAQTRGWIRALVTEALQPDPEPWLEEDRHHLNPRGADLVAGLLWDSLKGMLP